MLYRILTLLILLLAAPAWGAVRYIDPDCTNNGDGTTMACAASPDAAGAFNNWPETLNAGTYLQKEGTTVTPSLRPLVAANNTVLGVYDSSNGAAITYSGSVAGPGSRTATVDFNNAVDGFTQQWFTGLSVTGLTLSNAAVYNIQIIEGGSVSYCNISGAAADGIRVFNPNNNTVQYNTISFNADSGISVVVDSNGAGTSNIIGNTLYRNGKDNIKVFSTDTATKRGTALTISYNTSYQAGDSESHDGTGSGIYLYALDDSTVSYNNLYSNDTLQPGASTEGYGIALQDCRRIEISDNIIHDNNGHQIEIFSTLGTSGAQRSDDCVIRRNKIYNVGLGTIAAAISVKLDHTGTGTSVINNIIYNFSIGVYAGSDKSGAASVVNNTFVTTNGSYQPIRLKDGTAGYSFQNNLFSGGADSIHGEGSASGNTLSNNLYYPSGATLVYQWTGVADDYTSANITDIDSAAVASDPILNAAYGLAGNSPAKDAGAVLYTYAAHPGDYLGHKIYGNGPDIGAIEYQDHTFGGWFFEMFIPTIFNLCASTNANCYTQP